MTKHDALPPFVADMRAPDFTGVEPTITDVKFGQSITAANMKFEKNGGLTITGDIAVLNAVRAFVEKHMRIYLSLETSYKVDGVEQLKGPRICVHPQVSDYVFEMLYDVVLRESSDDRAHRLYQQHGADVLTRAKRLLDEAFGLVGTPDALDLLASVQRERANACPDTDVRRVGEERYEALTRLATRLR